MDTASLERLQTILSKEPHELIEADAAFLRARKAYLNGEQAKRFAEVLNDGKKSEPEPPTPKPEEPVPQPTQTEDLEAPQQTPPPAPQPPQAPGIDTTGNADPDNK